MSVTVGTILSQAPKATTFTGIATLDAQSARDSCHSRMLSRTIVDAGEHKSNDVWSPPGPQDPTLKMGTLLRSIRKKFRRETRTCKTAADFPAADLGHNLTQLPLGLYRLDQLAPKRLQFLTDRPNYAASRNKMLTHHAKQCTCCNLHTDHCK